VAEEVGWDVEQSLFYLGGLLDGRLLLFVMDWELKDGLFKPIVYEVGSS